MEYAKGLRAEGNALDAMAVFAGISSLFPAFPDLGAEGLYNALLLARKSGDVKRAAAFLAKLRKDFSRSPWTLELGPLRNLD
jgi:hypothetical protein